MTRANLPVTSGLPAGAGETIRVWIQEEGEPYAIGDRVYITRPTNFPGRKLVRLELILNRVDPPHGTMDPTGVIRSFITLVDAKDDQERHQNIPLARLLSTSLDLKRPPLTFTPFLWDPLKSYIRAYSTFNIPTYVDLIATYE